MAVGYTSREDVTVELRRKILGGFVAAGALLPEELLYGRHDLDPEDVSEILSQLGADGLIVAKPQPVVTGPLEEPALGVSISIRQLLESRGLTYLSRVADWRRVAQIWHELLDRMERASREQDLAELLEADFIVHQSLMDREELVELTPVCRYLTGRTRVVFPEALEDAAVRTEVVKLHKAVLEQVEYEAWNRADDCLRQLITFTAELHFSSRRQQLEVPVMVYVADEDVSADEGRTVVQAAVRYLEACGFYDRDPSYHVEEVGSFFARLRMAFQVICGSQSVQRVLHKVETGLENHYVRLPDSEVGQNQAEAAAKLIGAVAPFDNAVVVMGPAILIKKTTTTSTDVYVVPLVPRIREQIEADPTTIASPAAFFEMLEYLHHSTLDSHDMHPLRLGVVSPVVLRGDAHGADISESETDEGQAVS